MRFNWLKRKGGENTVNLAGGDAFQESPRVELVSIMVTTMLQNQFYRGANATVARIKGLIPQVADPRFVAKAALYARKSAGMRSVTHLVAGELAHAVKGQPWTAPFYSRVVQRPDDALEILACYLGTYGRPIPNSLKKGLGQALARFDEYQIAKYRKSDAEISLVDAVNLVHPPHTEALRKLVDGTLAPAETWETRLTQAGQAAETEGDLAEFKKEAWSSLVKDRKIGYFALLRNLRNILTAAQEVTEAAIAMLVDEKLIRKSLVLPFRYVTALEAIQQANLANASSVLAALSEAVDRSLANVPKFDGRTLIALDGSGSMRGRPIRIGALFAAALIKSNDADLLHFSEDAKYVSVNKRDSTLSIAQWLEQKAQCGGTNFHSIFQRANRGYDRIIILSDMQGWMGQHAPVQTFGAYQKKFGVQPKIFSFDLQGYGTLQFPERNVYCLAGFSDKTLETMKFLESDKQALIKQIEAIELN